MTKMHFKAFAEYIKHANVTPAEAQRMREMVASVARQFNSRFDAERFVDASTPDRKSA